MSTTTSKSPHTSNDRQLLMLIDGHAMVHRAWHAIQTPLTLRTSGEDVRAVYGFTNAFIKSINEWNPSHCAIAFDLPTPTFRHKLYDQYKAHRPPTPKDLVAQFTHIKKLMQLFAIPIFETEGFEADDILGTLSKQATEQEIRTIILTGDTDMLQLVSPYVQVVLNRGVQERTIYNEAAVRDRYGGLNPSQQPEIKAFQGDASDNIPGVPGIGSKTAIRLIQEFGSVDGVYQNIAGISPQRIQDIVATHEHNARQSLALTTIETKVPITLDMESSLFWQYNRDDLLTYFRDMEFYSIVDRVPHVSFPTDKNRTTAHPLSNPDYILIDNMNDLESLLQNTTKIGYFAFDIETTSKDAMKSRLVGISISSVPGQAAYIPLGHAEGKQIPLMDALDKLKVVLEDPDIHKYAHNGNYDMTVLANYGVKVESLTFDTMVAAHILSEPSVGLKNLAFSRLQTEMTPIETLIGTGKHQITMADVPINDAMLYASADSDMTLRLKDLFKTEMDKQEKLVTLFDDLEMPIVPVIVDIQRNGVAIDTNLLIDMSSDLENRLTTIADDIFNTLGHDFLISSTKQLADVLFNELSLPKTKRTKTGYSTDASVLENLRDMLTQGKLPATDPRSPSIIDGILAYRELAKLKSTYVDTLPNLVNNHTARVHTSYNQTGSSTGRISSNDPNLQNIPVRTQLGRQVRRAFIAPEGWIFLSADYSQIELRILAHLAQDIGLIEAFLNNEDIHSSTAAQVYDIPISAVTSDMRRIAKVMNFGVIYGLSAYGIAQQTDLAPGDGARFIENYFSKYPGIWHYSELVKSQAKKQGYLETISGRRRYFPDINSPNFHTRQAAERMAVNMPIQGTAADLIKIAMIRVNYAIQQRNLATKIILQVHDELIFEVPAYEAQEMQILVPDIMVSVMKLDVPLKVDIKSGTNWGDMA